MPATSPTPRLAAPRRRRTARVAVLAAALAMLVPAVALTGAISAEAASSRPVVVPGGSGANRYVAVSVSGSTTHGIQVDGTRCIAVSAGQTITYQVKSGRAAGAAVRSYSSPRCVASTQVGSLAIDPTRNAHFRASDSGVAIIVEG